MGEFLRKIDPLVHALLFVGLIALGVVVFGLQQQVKSLQGAPIKSNPLYQEQQLNSGVDETSQVTIEQVEELIANALEENDDSDDSATPQTVISTAPKQTQTTYIPLGTTSTSTSTNWYTVGDASAFIDVKNDFSGDPYITFEASLKVAHGNGQAFARLWDDTNKIAVNDSELSTTGNVDYQAVKSGRLYLWNGNNNYKVQLKSLNGFEVSYTNGKVKVVY